MAPSARGIASSHAARDVGVAFKLGDEDFTAPIKPRQAALAMPCRGSNVDLFVFRPTLLFPITLTLQNKQVFIVIRHGAPSGRLCSTMQANIITANAVSINNGKVGYELMIRNRPFAYHFERKAFSTAALLTP